MSDKFAYSLNKEDFHGEFGSREEALEEGITDLVENFDNSLERDLAGVPSSKIYTGKAVPYTVEMFTPETPLIEIMESMGEMAYDECGDFCDSWPNDINIPETEIETANEAIRNIVIELFKNNQPPCFKVIEVQEHTICQPQ